MRSPWCDFGVTTGDRLGDAVIREQPSKTSARSAPIRPLPPGVIPSPRREDPSESIPAGAPSGRDRARPKIAVVALAAIVAAVGLTFVLGHGGPPTGAPAPAHIVQRSPADLGYLDTVHQQAAFATIDDDSLIRTGHLLCERLRRGANPDQIALASIGKPYTAEDVSTALGAAVGAYCPDQMGRVGTSG